MPIPQCGANGPFVRVRARAPRAFCPKVMQAARESAREEREREGGQPSDRSATKRSYRAIAPMPGTFIPRLVRARKHGTGRGLSDEEVTPDTAVQRRLRPGS